MHRAAIDNLEAFLPQFGLREFRHGQKEVISTVLAGQEVSPLSGPELILDLLLAA